MTHAPPLANPGTLAFGGNSRAIGSVNTVSPSLGGCLSATDVFVLAGGLGTRIRPVLGDVPKLLAPVGGRTYLDHLLDWLRRFGVRRIVLGLGIHAKAVLDYLDTHPTPGVTIESAVEPAPLGTAGAIRFARTALHSDPVMVLNGDSYADADLCRLLDRHRTSRASATMLCAKVDNAGRYGRVVLDSDDFVESFIEKDSTFHGEAWINAGVYLVSAPLLDLIAAGTGASLERDVFERLPRRSLAGFTECRKFLDIGTPETLSLAAEFFNAPVGAGQSR